VLKNLTISGDDLDTCPLLVCFMQLALKISHVHVFKFQAEGLRCQDSISIQSKPLVHKELEAWGGSSSEDKSNTSSGQDELRIYSYLAQPYAINDGGMIELICRQGMSLT